MLRNSPYGLDTEVKVLKQFTSARDAASPFKGWHGTERLVPMTAEDKQAEREFDTKVERDNMNRARGEPPLEIM